MPIYEYVCQACGAETEILQRISDPPEKQCPACRKPKLVKQLSAAGFRLAGGGWYETDFKKDGKRNLAGEKSEESKPAEAKADGGEKKVEAKAEPKKDAPKGGDKPTKPEKPAKKEAADKKKAA